MEKKTVLIVDDHDDLRLYLKQELKKKYDIMEAGSGQQALDLVAASKPDIIVCDIMMPGMDGIEVLKTLKEDQENARIPVILLTAKQSDEDMMQGLVSGADDYIRKPFSINILKIRLEHLLALGNE